MAKVDVAAELQKLIDQYNSNPAYTAKSADQLKAQATDEYASYYDQLRLSAQQQTESTDLALQQQRAGLQSSYDRQRENSAKQYAGAYSQSDRQMLSRGMQRSSYGAQTLANINKEGAEAQNYIGEQQGAAEGNIDAQRTNLASQLAAQISQYSAGQTKDIMARMRELENTEYERGQDASNLKSDMATQIYNLLYQQSRDQVEAERYAAANTKSTKSTKSTNPTPPPTTQPQDTSYQDWLDSMAYKAPTTTPSFGANLFNPIVTGIIKPPVIPAQKKTTTPAKPLNKGANRI